MVVCRNGSHSKTNFGKNTRENLLPWTLQGGLWEFPTLSRNYISIQFISQKEGRWRRAWRQRNVTPGNKAFGNASRRSLILTVFMTEYYFDINGYCGTIWNFSADLHGFFYLVIYDLFIGHSVVWTSWDILRKTSVDIACPNFVQMTQSIPMPFWWPEISAACKLL